MAKTPQAILELKDVFLTRDGKPVLNGLNWTAREGEHWFLLGQNGSGKTSLLEVLMGYLWATRGSVRVMGETFGKVNLPELRKKIGFVAPWVVKRIKPWETVRQAVAAGAEALVETTGPIPRELNRRVEAALRFAGCGRHADKLFDKLSTGEQLKAVIARALVARPRVLILDEPFSALDLGSRALVYDFLARLAARKNAPLILLVTHQTEDILPFFTHGLCLKDGRVRAAGPKKQILTSEVLRRTFGVRVSVSHSRGRTVLSSPQGR
ncbi:MAG TPA: ATP-binding cassette domain-containing protein [Verrucomicrobiae bacterium]|nr:ATP-binding cassette domain-containing protein [Verrucomicrobiae bacterium]